MKESEKIEKYLDFLSEQEKILEYGVDGRTNNCVFETISESLKRIL